MNTKIFRTAGASALALLIAVGSVGCSTEKVSEPTSSSTSKAPVESKSPEKKVHTKKEVAKFVDEFFETVGEDTSDSMGKMTAAGKKEINGKVVSESEAQDLFESYYPNALEMLDPKMKSIDKQSIVGQIGLAYLFGSEIEARADSKQVKIKGDTATLDSKHIKIWMEGEEVVVPEGQDSESGILHMKYIDEDWVISKLETPKPKSASKSTKSSNNT